MTLTDRQLSISAQMHPRSRSEPDDPEAFVDEAEQKVRTHVLATMPNDPSGELTQKSFTQLLIVYGTWRSRFVRAQRRTTRLSTQVALAAAQPDHRDAIAEIVDAIHSGSELTKYLSRGVRTAYTPTNERSPKLQRRGDLDLLIADWGIHHLHLGRTVEADGFVARTDDLLFARFAPDTAFLLAIYPHGAWGRLDLLRVLAREFDGADVLTKMHGLRRLEPTDEAEHLEARKGGVLDLVEIDGAVYLPMSGITTAGTPGDVTTRAHNVANLLDHWRQHLADELTRRDAEYGASTEPWRPHVEDDAIGLRRGDQWERVADLW